MTLYVPGALLKDSKNTIEIFDVEPKGKTYVELFDSHQPKDGHNTTVFIFIPVRCTAMCFAHNKNIENY